MHNNSCKLSDKGKECCSSSEAVNSELDLKEHWNKIYSNSPEEKLGWFETDLSPTLRLVEQSNIEKEARILTVGAGSTNLIDELINLGYKNLIASDISELALENLKQRASNARVEYVLDDLTQPTKLNQIEMVDLWIDRAVLHFFTEKEDQDAYFDLLKSKVKKNGYALLAEYNLKGATVCAGLPVHRYSKETLSEKLGTEFQLIDNFEYIYLMPSGDKRPYIYTLFKKV